MAKDGIIALMLVAMVVWYFAAVDRNTKRQIFGPYQTENECKGHRNVEVTNDRWVAVSECEAKTS
jgi:hypothetical protein